MKNFTATAQILNELNQRVLYRGKIEMEWNGQGWHNATEITFKALERAHVDKLYLYDDKGVLLRKTAFGIAFMHAGDSLTVKVGTFNLEIDESTRAIFEYVAEPKPDPDEPTEEELEAVVAELMAIEMSLTPRKRREPLKARPRRERPLRAGDV